MKIRVHGVELAYEDTGTGLPVVLIHGFPFSRQMWRSQVAVLSKAYRVITPDLRGFGESHGTLVNIEGLAEDVHALLEELQLRPFVAGGFSMGGYVLFRYLAHHADRVNAVMLLDTRAEADTPEAHVRRYAGIDKIKREGPNPFLDDFQKVVVSSRTLESRPEVVTEVRRLMAGTKAESLTAGLRAIAERPDSTSLLHTLTVPTLIVVGEDDKATPVDSARKMHEAIKGSKLIVIPGAGHMSNLEQPERFNAALLEFLSMVPS